MESGSYNDCHSDVLAWFLIGSMVVIHVLGGLV